MLARLHEKRAAGQRLDQPVHRAAVAALRRGEGAGPPAQAPPNGDVWQWDLWQAGMGLVDFTSPDADALVPGEAAAAAAPGRGRASRPTSASASRSTSSYFDGSDPERMHNFYTQLYNAAVFEVLEQERGTGEAVLFARSATAGGQRIPVHWGGDSTSTFASMAETLRGGLSLALSAGSGSGATTSAVSRAPPTPAVFKRWTRVRPAVEPQPVPRQRLLPGAVGVRRGGRRGHPHASPGAEDAG